MIFPVFLETRHVQNLNGASSFAKVAANHPHFRLSSSDKTTDSAANYLFFVPLRRFDASLDHSNGSLTFPDWAINRINAFFKFPSAINANVT